VGVYFLGRGTNRDCGQQESNQRLLCERRCFKAKIHTVLVAALILALPI